MNAAEVIEALQRHLPPARGWVTVPEVRIAPTGAYSDLPEDLRWCAEQRIDLFTMNAFPGNHYERIAVEVKVSRGDFMSEVRNPDKRRAAELLANRFVFAVPKGLVSREEVPDGCGLWEVSDQGVRRTIPGVRREHPVLPLPWVASLLRTAADQRPIQRCGWDGCRSQSGWRIPVRQGVVIGMCTKHRTQWDGQQAAA